MRGLILTTMLLATMTGSLADTSRGQVPAADRTARFGILADKDTEVVFESRAPMENFDGRTNRVSGWLEADPDDLTQPFRFEVAVDMASLDTGNSKRNGHMRENHLETGKYPTAMFTGGKLGPGSPTAVPVGGSAALQVVGTLDLHGVTRTVTCAVEAERPDDGTLRVTARFEVLLDDYGIERPKFLFLKLAEDQQVTVRLVLEKGKGT